MIILSAGVATAAETPVVRGAEKALAVAENVEGREEVKLTATIGPDTYDFDQAIWCEPTFVMKDGTRVDATTLEPRAAKAGWGKVEANRVNWGGSKVAKVGGESFKRFISAHAPSILILSVPKGAVRFEARGGLTAPKGKGSCTFKVEAGEFSRSERIAALAAATRAALPALERLIEYRRTTNPELAPKLDAVAARFDEAKRALQRVAGDRVNGQDARCPSGVVEAAEETLKRLDGIKRELMIDLNPAVGFDRLLFIEFSPIEYTSERKRVMSKASFS